MDPVLESILDDARWAPSGDNTQPWRFEVAGPRHVVVHGFDTRDHCVYDIDGHPSHIALGALVETMAIAASGHRLGTAVALRPGQPDTAPILDVKFEPADGNPSPLLACIRTRAVQRRSMSLKRLTPDQKLALEVSLGPDNKVVWRETLNERFKMASLLFTSAKIRLTMPEAYEVHKSIIEWNAQFSEDRVPDQAVGLDPMALKLMRFAMASWTRVEFLNKWLAGTVMPRLELDFVPGIACAAHFVITSARPAVSVNDFLAAGRAVQRFWLTATKLGLQLQPELTPLIFSAYVRQGRTFTQASRPQHEAHGVALQLRRLIGPRAAELAVFMGRVGSGKPARARSLRLPLARLMVR